MTTSADRGRAYAERALRHAEDRNREATRSRLISRLRLATFLPAAALVILYLTRVTGAWTALAALPLLLLFAVFVVWHALVEDRMEWHDALRIVAERAVARIARDWKGLPVVDPPAAIDVSGHPYAVDLDLFGRASLYQWIGPAATAPGATTLAHWLLEPAPAGEIWRRQAGVAVLAAADHWREAYAAHGLRAGGARDAEIQRFLAWTESRDDVGGPALRAAVYAVLAAIVALIALHAAGVIASAFWLIPIVAGLILSFWKALAIHTSFDRAGAGQRALSRYAPLFEHAVKAPDDAPYLVDLSQRLTAEGADAAACMRKLNRILGFAELRSGAAILHFPIQALTLWDFHVLFALERWRRAAGTRMRDWMRALGELDALSTLAGIQHDNPSWCVPEVTGVDRLTAAALGHPLLPDDRRVPNDVEVGPPGTVLLVTGSNMSGKSTLLRAIGLNAVLAQAGGPACATSLRMPPSDLESSIRVQDSLELGLSYFMAALARLKGVVDAAERERPGRTLLYLLDEILQGTNSIERAIAVRAVTRHLLDAGAIGAMTTHDLALAEDEPLKSSARLVHFTETVDESGAMRFDYVLRPGLATSRNALRLMKLIGIDP